MFTNLKKNNQPFIIAEVGQNHQGDLDLAREYIKVFAAEGADAVKFQTRNNKYLFSETAYLAPYTSENAFAYTYGEHREKLELKPEWLPILKQDCVKYDVKFMSTPFDEPSLDLLKEIDKIKKEISLLRNEVEASVLDPIKTGFIFYDKKDYDQAIKYFNIGLSRIENNKYGNKYAYFLFLSQAYLSKGEPTKAISYSDSVLIINPYEPKAIAVKSAALFLSGKNKEGLEIINDFIKNKKKIGNAQILYNSLLNFSKNNKGIIEIPATINNSEEPNKSINVGAVRNAKIAAIVSPAPNLANHCLPF